MIRARLANLEISRGLEKGRRGAAGSESVACPLRAVRKGIQQHDGAGVQEEIDFLDGCKGIRFFFGLASLLDAAAERAGMPAIKGFLERLADVRAF